jgi:glyoxylase-like metal-dependent hydrolase (beta-lactamase superfamily II)
VQKLSPNVTMIKVSVGPMDNNAYLLQPRTGGGVLIDAANDADRLVSLIDAQPVETIVTTHRHRDHWQALGRVAAAVTPERLVAGNPDVEAIASGTGLQVLVGVWDGDRIELGEESLEVIGLVGHTPGSITLVYSGGPTTHLFTGDSLFPGGPGKTTSPEDFNSLMNDLEAKIFARFNDDTVVHPGHGEDTTLGVERPHLGEWRARGW